jgi:small GTP-binding protein
MDVIKVTLLGHKDHGKSTLIGSMLMSTDSVTKERIADAKKTSKNLNVKFEPGFILDSFAEEREGGLTIDTTRAQMKYKGYAFEFIDVPGHEELIKNMISGASYADFAILVVSAKSDEGIKDQTKRHIFISKMMGTKNIIVAVNKMDTVKYSKERFEDIKLSLSPFLNKIGFADKNITFIPISAYNAENITRKSTNMKWYKGKTVLDALSVYSKNHLIAQGKNTRVAIQGFLEGHNKIISGRVIKGKISKKQKIIVMPANKYYNIEKIFVKGAQKQNAKEGENIALELKPDPTFNPRGSIICTDSDKIQPKNVISTTIFIISRISGKIKIKFNGDEYLCKSIQVKETINPVTGDVHKGYPKPLEAGNAIINLNSKILAEPFSSNAFLGRFVIYKGNKFIGIGIIK